MRRLAEADLIGDDHAVAGIAQRPDGVLPGCAAEVLAVQEHDGLAVRLRRTDVHVGHGQRLALRLEFVALNRMRIVEVGEERIGIGATRHRAGEQDR